VRFDGVLHHVDSTAPYGFPDGSPSVTGMGLFGTGSHTVEFIFKLAGTTTVSGQACVTVQEGFPPSVETVTLKVVGNPATGPWGVKGSTTDPRDVNAWVRFDGVLHHVDSTAPYGFPDGSPGVTSMGEFGIGSHTVEFIFMLAGTTTVSGRACVTVQEGTP
jgi:hypothetical protein